MLDIGCGCGVTTLTAATTARRAVGVDISTPLLEIAAARADAASLTNAEFVVADAQTHPFDEAVFDIVISQFGIMFFDDPVTAFTNIRRSITPGGRVAVVSWQGLEANEWLSIVGRAVARHAELPDLGGFAGGPGMFAWKHAEESIALLGEAGFDNAAAEPLAPTILLAGGGTVDETMAFLLGMGIVRGLLGRLDDDARSDAIAAIHDELVERHEPGVGVSAGAAGWLVTATA